MKINWQLYNTTGCNDWGIGVRFPTGERHFSLLHRTHIVSGAHPNSHSMGNRASGQNKWVVNLSTHIHVMRRFKNHELLMHSIICLQWVVLNWAQEGLYLYVFGKTAERSGHSISTIQVKQGRTEGKTRKPESEQHVFGTRSDSQTSHMWISPVYFALTNWPEFLCDKGKPPGRNWKRVPP